MTEFLHPGVFVEETSFRSRPIEGVPTGVAGFVRVSKEATPIGVFTSAAEFERDNFQWDAARSFFEEGGKRLLVAHAASGGAADVAAALDTLTDADVVAAPGLTGPGVAPALIAHAENKRRFALIDPPPGLDVAGVRTFRGGLDSGHAALHWPWIVTVRGTEPPSPRIAGVIARVDTARGVWKAPANEAVTGATGFAHPLTKAEQDILSPLGINCLRSFPGRGNLVWGARTLSSDQTWKYVNLRRQCDWLEGSLHAGLQWAMFEPNAEPLWANVRRAAGDFLLAHWQAGGLQGAKPEQAFFVRADRTTMTQDDLDNGRLVVEVGFAPLKPAEFVIFRIVLPTAAQAA